MALVPAISDEPKSYETYDPPEKDRKTINRVYDRLQKMQYQRERKYSYFNDRSLLQYIDDSTKRWNGYIPPRDDLTMDWQAKVFDNFTRNVVIQYLAKVAMQRPKSRFIATNNNGFEDTKRAHVLDKLFQYSKRKEDGEYKFLQAALECATKGTVILYEGFRKIKRKVKELEKYDPVTGNVLFKEREILDYNDCYQQVIPLEDFYVGNIYEASIHFQPDLCWKTVLRKADFKEEFSKYPNFKKVQPGAYTALNESLAFFKNKNYAELETDQVEVVRYFNRLRDEMVVCANGVLLYDGPIPFHHKDYPFAKGVQEQFAIDFFYGKSIPDKCQNDQDVRNTLLAMMIDQSLVSMYKPILTDDEDEIDTQIMVPNAIIKVNDINRYKVMSELTGPDASHFNMFQLITQLSQENSGAMMGGAKAQTSRGGKMTARQAMMIEEQSRQVLGLNTKQLEKMEHDADILRCKNILQFYTIPEKNAEILGLKDADVKKGIIRLIRLDDSELSDGTYGTSVIKMFQSDKHLPQSEDLAVEEEMARMQGENLEVFAMTADYIRNMDFDVQIIGESSYQQSKSLEQAMADEFYSMAMNNPLINQEENTRDWVQSRDKDPDRFMKANPMMSPNGTVMPQNQSNMQGGTQAPQGEIGSQIRANKPSLDRML